MARFIALFVRRPVLAIVVSLVILMLGLRSIQTLNVRQYPESSAAVVTITTPYAGANAELVRGFVTAPLEQAIASANGIDFLDSSSAQGVSTIRAHLELNYDPNAAVAQILTKINQVRNQLPPDSENPVVTVSVGEFAASMYLAFASEVLAPHQVTTTSCVPSACSSRALTASSKRKSSGRKRSPCASGSIRNGSPPTA